MSGWRKRVLQIGIASIFVVQGLALAGAILLQSIWAIVVVSGVIAFSLYFFYVRLYQNREARYPLVPPEGKVDIYFPRTDIPRPIYGDIRRMEEKKRRLAKIKKKMRWKKK